MVLRGYGGDGVRGAEADAKRTSLLDLTSLEGGGGGNDWRVPSLVTLTAAPPRGTTMPSDLRAERRSLRSFVALLSSSGTRAYEHDLFDLEQFEHRPLAPSQRTFLRGEEYRRSI
jgi:hypothetical protein